MSLFTNGKFTAHSGEELEFKMDCDFLTYEDIETIASIIARTHTFRRVYGIPTGGSRLAAALEKYISDDGDVLIVDDVLTSGASMEESRADIGDEAVGIVIFARGPCPPWVKPVFQLSEWAGP